MWHCPHCGAPQAEAARCWVCRRSSTTCSTCRHFRPSLATDLGYCGKDRRRAPLTGLELRPCWEEGGRAGAARRGAPNPEQPAESSTGGPLDRPNPMRLRGFVPLDELVPPPPPEPPVAGASLPPAILGDTPEGWESRSSLFGEAEA